MPSYSRWATDIVRFGLKPSLRLASCWSVDVVNGAAGDRFCVRVPTFVTLGWRASMAARWRSAVASSPTSRAAPSIRTTSAVNRSPAAVDRSASIVQYSRAVNASISRSRSTTSRTATDWTRPADRPPRTLRDEQRAQRVADEPVDDPAGLLGVDEVRVDLARMSERLADRRFGDLAEGDPLGLAGRHVGCLGDVPGDRLALAVEVGGEEDLVGALGGLLDVGDLLAAILRDDVLRGEIMVDVDPELALAGVLRQVADVAVGGQDAVVEPR